jgi:hypothetical protein
MHLSQQDAPFGVLGLLYLLKMSQTGSGHSNLLQVEDSNAYDFVCVVGKHESDVGRC